MPGNTYVSKLKNAPLKEVIFDIRWNLDIDDDTNKFYDANFDLALGKFHNTIKKEFSKIERIVPPFIPKEFANYIPQFRFSKETTYPLIQLGEGVLSINDNDINYEWKNNFSPLIRDTLTKLCNSYEKSLTFNRVSLRYIDAVNLSDIESKNFPKFLAEKLNYEIKKSFESPGELSSFNYNEIFKLPGGDNLQLVFSSGVDKETQAPQIIWQYIVFKDVEQSQQDVFIWLDKAHKVTSDLFITMLNQDFYASFK